MSEEIVDQKPRPVTPTLVTQRSGSAPLSPLPQKQAPDTHTLLSFPDALQAIIKDGVRITRKEWGDVNIYGFMQKGYLHIKLKEGDIKQWILSDGDLYAEDWITL